MKRLNATGSAAEPDFWKEAQHLKRFSGLTHDHLITLLATFEQEKVYYFLFPCADCDLLSYWETVSPERTSKVDIGEAQWMAKQLRGLMGAASVIHYPGHLSLDVARFGRHGDIKPDNILWFKSHPGDSRGVLVLSDYGLSSFNRHTSRSGIPNNSVQGAPGYRPPECHIEGGTISRAYDIWTLGCLYMEFMTWFLGGNGLREEFSKRRTTLSWNGANNDDFFRIVKAPSNNDQIAQVKPEVTQVQANLYT